MNCSAIPVGLVESELFGHLRGAFTGATSTREGLFEAANNGTIFLDEVGDLPPQVQVKLLRALQEGEIKRVGSNETRKVDVRVIAATNVDLRTRIVSGRFREDLFYRLNVVAIEMPPLRKRREDIPLLAQHFLTKYAARAGRNITQLAPETMRLLQRRTWPGNVRELENAIEHAVVFCRGEVIEPEDLPSYHATQDEPQVTDSMPPLAPDTWGETLAELPYKRAKQKAMVAFDAAYFAALLQRAQGNVSEAARLAGLDRTNFRRAARRSGAGGDES
jgi:two-component system response regulator HydG